MPLKYFAQYTVFLELKRRLKGDAQLFYYKNKTRKEIGIKEGMIINGNIKDSTVEDGTRISIVPIWEFLILNP
jgi:hypothetical protein